MLEKPLFKPLFFSVVLLGVLHIAAIELYWYWIFWWMDVITHYLGGLIIGFAVIIFLFFSGFTNKFEISPTRAFFTVALSVIVIGVGWEIFEYSLGVFDTEPMFPDTIHDIFADLAGAMSAHAFLLLRYKDLVWNKKDQD